MPRLSKIGAAALAAFGWTSGTSVTNVTANYLAVAGGGGGGYSHSGGGGAGGYITSTLSLSPLNTYTIVVGAGGAGVNGSNTIISGTGLSTVTAIGGGAGATYSVGTGSNGGSGGGGAGTNSPSSGGSGTSGQGNAGGSGGLSVSNYREGGGGGGAGAAGDAAYLAGNSAGNGGAGLASSISGTSTYYAGGGGGGSNNAAAGAGGTGGGGAGGSGSPDANGVSGTANTGGGGGGAGGNANNSNGGSGVVIISYLGPQKFGGGIVTTSGSNVIHTFNTSGTLSPLSTLSASYLIVAGGGGGGNAVIGSYNGSGGGAGGLLSGTGLTIDANSTYLVTVGSGGSSGGPGTNGTNSAFSMVTTTAIGGGRGGSGGNGVQGATGGSGGGSTGPFTASPPTAGGLGTAGQGNAGGPAPQYSGSGGGGAGGAGTAFVNTSTPTGGAGLSSSISGASVGYAGGGSGGGTPSPGFGGGTGADVSGTSPATAGTAGTGGGGGGGSNPTQSAANGGSGVVIISYPGSVQQMAGGTVTISGGNVIHTFTSSGYLTPLRFLGNSLRFRNSASAYLARTPTTSGSATTWTWSGWVKRGLLTSGVMPLFTSYISTTQYSVIDFNGSDCIRVLMNNGASEQGFVTNAVYRDPAAWYHIVVAAAPSSLKLYINGVEVTSFSSNVTVTQNWLYSTANPMWLGREQYGASNNYFDGEMAEVRFIDGQALTPNSFGTFNSYGVWQPITYGGSYGTNGFYLPFTANQSYTGVFSGSSQWVSVPNLSAFNVGTSDYTVEGWFYFNSLPSSQGLFGCDNGAGSTPKFLGLVNSSGAVLLEFTNSGGATFLTSSSGAVTTGKWYHIAWVRSSGTSTIYVNGVNVGSTATSVNLAGLTQAWNIGYIGEAGPSSLAGYASNFRLVTGTAVYTSNFVPQTTALTAISGTQILTLQNATLVDNSSNAQTVTNTGGVTTGATYPFAYIGSTVKDFGPAGNNWTANNVGFTTGSTLDEMTDVPTLTSATAANYAVLNPLRPFGGSTSNGNLTAVTGNSGSANSGYVTSTIWFPSSGKFYFEVIPTSVSEIAIGLTTDSNSRAAIYYRAGEIYINGSVATTQSSYTNNDVIGVAFDIGAATVQFYKNNTAQGSAQSISAITSPLVACIVQLSGSSSATANINFGQQPFVYTPPSGFVALNTYNL